MYQVYIAIYYEHFYSLFLIFQRLNYLVLNSASHKWVCEESIISLRIFIIAKKWKKLLL